MDHPAATTGRAAARELTPAQVLACYPAHTGSLAGLLASRAAARPDHVFIEFDGGRHTYAEVEAASQAAAAWYQERGVRPGDRVGVMARNHVSTVVSLFGLARIGAILCPINPDLLASEAGYLLGHADVAGVLCSPECLPVLREATAQAGLQPWLLLNRGGDKALSLPDWDSALAANAGVRVPDKGSPDSTCVIIYTSGTTGQPKGVMHAQRSVLLAGEGFVGRLHLQPDERLLCVLPLFHINALFYSVVGSLAAGATVLLQKGFSASEFWRTAAELGATEVNVVAAVPGILARRPAHEFVEGHRLRKICVAPLSAEMERLFRERFGVPDLIDGYGMTEIPGVAITPMHGPRRVGSVGRLCRHPDESMEFAQLRVVDDDGRDLPDGCTGEFLVKTPTVMQGYFRDPAQTRDAFRDGWFVTGDLGYRDADGFIWFVARKKDIIRRRGENISGAELDRVIGDHPAVQETAAIAVPAELGEDEILVAVVPRPGQCPTPVEIARWCESRLARSKLPRYVVIVEGLPHTATHRVAKHLLKADKTLLARATDLSQGSVA